MGHPLGIFPKEWGTQCPVKDVFFRGIVFGPPFFKTYFGPVPQFFDTTWSLKEANPSENSRIPRRVYHDISYHIKSSHISYELHNHKSLLSSIIKY